MHCIREKRWRQIFHLFARFRSTFWVIGYDFITWTARRQTKRKKKTNHITQCDSLWEAACPFLWRYQPLLEINSFCFAHAWPDVWISWWAINWSCPRSTPSWKAGTIHHNHPQTLPLGPFDIHATKPFHSNCNFLFIFTKATLIGQTLFPVPTYIYLIATIPMWRSLPSTTNTLFPCWKPIIPNTNILMIIGSSTLPNNIPCEYMIPMRQNYLLFLRYSVLWNRIPFRVWAAIGRYVWSIVAILICYGMPTISCTNLHGFNGMGVEIIL